MSFRLAKLTHCKASLSSLEKGMVFSVSMLCFSVDKGFSTSTQLTFGTVEFFIKVGRAVLGPEGCLAASLTST